MNNYITIVSLCALMTACAVRGGPSQGKVESGVVMTEEERKMPVGLLFFEASCPDAGERRVFSCSANAISKDLVTTAAHCVNYSGQRVESIVVWNDYNQMQRILPERDISCRSEVEVARIMEQVAEQVSVGSSGAVAAVIDKDTMDKGVFFPEGFAPSVERNAPHHEDIALLHVPNLSQDITRVRLGGAAVCQQTNEFDIVGLGTKDCRWHYPEFVEVRHVDGGNVEIEVGERRLPMRGLDRTYSVGKARYPRMTDAQEELDRIWQPIWNIWADRIPGYTFQIAFPFHQGFAREFELPEDLGREEAETGQLCRGDSGAGYYTENARGEKSLCYVQSALSAFMTPNFEQLIMSAEELESKIERGEILYPIDLHDDTLWEENRGPVWGAAYDTAAAVPVYTEHFCDMLAAALDEGAEMPVGVEEMCPENGV